MLLRAVLCKALPSLRQFKREISCTVFFKVAMLQAVHITTQFLDCVTLSTDEGFPAITVMVIYAEAVMSDDAILLKLEEDFTCPITQACLLTSMTFFPTPVTHLDSCLQSPLPRFVTSHTFRQCLVLQQHKM